MEQENINVGNIEGAEAQTAPQLPEISNSADLNLTKKYPSVVKNVVSQLRVDSSDTFQKYQTQFPTIPEYNPASTTSVAPTNPVLNELVTNGNKVQMSRRSNVKRSDVFDTLSDGSEINKYPEFYEWRDNNEYYAQRQTAGEKWGNGAQKFLGKTIAGVGGNIIGSFYGLGEAIVTGNRDAIYDNSFMDMMDDFNTKLDHQLPNYYTNAERDLGLVAGMGTANFWADKVLGGAQFTASAIVSEVILAKLSGGLSLATTGARAGLRVGSALSKTDATARALAKSASRLNSKQMLEKATSLTRNERIGLNVGNKLGKIGSTARYMYTSSMYEAGFETRMFEKDMISKFKEDKPDYTLEELTDFHNNLKEASSFVWKMNMAIVGTSNVVGPMAQILGRSAPPTFKGTFLSRNLLGAGARTNNKGITTAIKAKNWQKSLRTPAMFMKASIPEAMEEGGQGLTTLGAEKWLNMAISDEDLGTLKSLMGVTLEGIPEYTSSKEGQEEMLIGAIIGSIMGGGQSIRANKNFSGEYNRIQELAEKVEKFSAETGTRQKVIDQLMYASRQIANTKKLDKAKADGDLFAMDQATMDAIISSLSFGNDVEYLDQTIDDFRTTIENTDVNTIMEAYGIKEKNRAVAEEMKATRLTQFNEIAESFQKNTEFAEQYIGDRLTKSEIEAFGTDTNARDARNALAYALTIGEQSTKDMETYFNEAIGELAGIIGKRRTEALSVLNKAKSKADRGDKKLKDLLERFEVLEEEISTQEKLREKLIKKGKVTVEGEVNATNDLEVLAQEILNNAEEQQRITNQINAINKATEDIEGNPLASKDNFVTVESLKELQQTMNEVRGMINKNEADMSDSEYLMTQAFNNFERASENFINYNTLLQQMRTGKVQLTGSKGLLNITNKSVVNENTQKFIDALLGTKATNEAIARENSTGVDVRAPLTNEDGTLQPTYTAFGPRVKAPKVETKPKNLMEEVQKVLSESAYIQYSGTVVDENDVPNTVEGLAEYVKEAMENPNKMTSAKQAVLRTIFNSEGISLEELLIQLRQLQFDKGTVTEVSPVMNEGDTTNLITESEGVSYSPNGMQVSERDARITQTYDQVFVKGKDEDTMIIYNITPVGLMNALGATGQAKLIKSDGSAETVEISSLNEAKAPGANNRGFVVEINGQPMSFTFSETNGNIEANAVQLKEAFQANGMQTFQSAATTTNKYLMVYQGGKPMDSDFNDSTQGLGYTSQDMYNLNKGDKVTFKFDPNDPYNVQLREQYNTATGGRALGKKAQEELDQKMRDQVKVSVYDAKGNKISELKANSNTSNVTSEFTNIREKALQEFKKQGNTQVDLGITVDVEHVFLGLPVLTIVDGQVVHNEIDPKDVVDVGYFSNNKLKTKNNTDLVNTDLVKRLKKSEVPIVVVRHGNQLIAYPVNMKTKQGNSSQEFRDRLDTAQDEEIAQIVIDINNKLIELGRNPKDYNITYANSEIQTVFNEDQSGTFTEGLEKALEDITALDSYYNYKDWVKKSFDMNSITEQAEISVNLKTDFMTSPKLLLNFGDQVETSPRPISNQTQETKKLKQSGEVIESIKTLGELARKGKKIQESLKFWRPRAETLNTSVTTITKGRKTFTLIKSRHLPEYVLVNKNIKSDTQVALFLTEIETIRNNKDLKPKQKAEANKKASEAFLNKKVKGTLVGTFAKGSKVENLLKLNESEEYTKYINELKSIQEASRKLFETIKAGTVTSQVNLTQAEQDKLDSVINISQESIELIKEFDKCK